MHGYRRVAPLPWAEAVELESDITRGGCHGTVPARLVVGQEARAETRLAGRSIRTISTVVVAVSRVLFFGEKSKSLLDGIIGPPVGS